MTRRLSRRQVLKYSGITTVALAGCAGEGGDSEGQGTTAQTGMEPTTVDQSTSTPSVELAVSDQEVQSRTITIPTATIDKRGWLVVHPEAEDGGPNGKVVLGKKMLSASSHENVELALSRVTTDATTVYGMLHYDDPADGEFTFPKDGDPPVTKDGSPVVKPFDVTLTGEVTPALSVTTQQTDGTSVTVPSASIDKAGWLVIHPEAEGGGPNGKVVLAERQLAPGLYADQTLALSEPLGADQTLYGMLHYDAPSDGEFTFPQDGDPPVTADGSPIVKPFDVTVTSGMSGGTETVEAIDTSFDPKRLSVSPGTTVEWVNRDSYGHDVTSAAFHENAAEWEMSASLSGSGGSATHTFEETGVYEYYCSIHGKGTMCGAILVGDVSLDKELPCEGGGGGG